METLILLAISGIIAAVFATQNTGTVSVTVLQYTLHNIPLYLLVAGSLLVGLLLSSMVSLVTSISTSFRMHGKDVKIKESKKTSADLAKRNHELELEVATLKERANITPEE